MKYSTLYSTIENVILLQCTSSCWLLWSAPHSCTIDIVVGVCQLLHTPDRVYHPPAAFEAEAGSGPSACPLMPKTLVLYQKNIHFDISDIQWQYHDNSTKSLFYLWFTISWWNIKDVYLGPVTELICVSTVHSTDVKPCIFDLDWAEHQVWGRAVMYLKSCVSYMIVWMTED